MGSFGANEKIYKTFKFPAYESFEASFYVYFLDHWDGEWFNIYIDGDFYSSANYDKGTGSAPLCDSYPPYDGTNYDKDKESFLTVSDTLDYADPVELRFESTLNDAYDQESWAIKELEIKIPVCEVYGCKTCDGGPFTCSECVSPFYVYND